MLSDCLFDGDLQESKHSESNILAASESMVIESLTQIREGLRNDEGSDFGEVHLENIEPIFDRTPDVELPPTSDSDDTDEDNTPLRWAVQERMVPVIAKGKEKVVDETPKRKPFTRATNQKFMGDALKSKKQPLKKIEEGEKLVKWRLIYLLREWWQSQMNFLRMIPSQRISHWLRYKGEMRNKKSPKGRENLTTSL
ncbi:hypothetical protein KY285_000807 [Solanum tuberosum]|nr:hypothetical protein KY285_000807 [Solanum tuberosum]